MRVAVLYTSVACVQGRSLPNLKTTALTPAGKGLDLTPDWTLLTREVLNLPENQSESVCLKPDTNELAEWSSAIAGAEAQYKLRKRLESFFERLKDQKESWQDHESLLSRLEQCAQILQSACTSHLAEGPNLSPEWSAEPDTLKAQVVKFIYDNLFQQFDKDGFAQLTSKVMADNAQMRFAQSLASVQTSMPHCDLGGGEATIGNMGIAGGAPFPGGPFRLNFGFNLSKMLSDQLMAAGEKGSSGSGAISNMMTMTAMMSVISVVETAVAIVVDVVPPMIPPPFWILWSLPCLPMLTGPNCLFSVLYPVGLSDFMLASTTDQIMNGIISGFPAKYAAKVGKTSDAAYKLCAMAYLGMHCASIFPLCWIPMGVRTAMTFPMCFVHCILTLAACPGFWIDDIIGPCSTISVPPLCSFSLYVNVDRVPPQYTSYADGHPFPADCPDYNPTYDVIAEEVSTETAAVPIEEDIEPFPAGESLVGDLDDYANVVTPKYFLCDCSNLCPLRNGSTSCEADEACADACTGVSHPRPVATTTTSAKPAGLKRILAKDMIAVQSLALNEVVKGHILPIAGRH